MILWLYHIKLGKFNSSLFRFKTLIFFDFNI